jgi:hypothetical protein
MAVALGGVGAGLTAGGRSGLGWPVLIGAVAAIVGAAWMRADRRTMLTRLVAQGDALSMPDVRVYADRLVARRLVIASGLRHVISSCARGSGELVLVQPERVDAHADRLKRLADAFADPHVPIHPVSAALCVRMLREPASSPLYNPHVPADELDRLLTAIERGIAA